jgi:hypothetical protein
MAFSFARREAGAWDGCGEIFPILSASTILVVSVNTCLRQLTPFSPWALLTSWPLHFAPSRF